MYKTILYDWNEKDGYITITLNRPEKRNAVSGLMCEELDEALEKAKKEDLKFLILTGAGEKAFCSGGDLEFFHADLDGDEAAERLGKMKDLLYKIATFPVPTICMLNRDARGGGCELASACDFRFADEDSSHGFVQGKLGILPGWGGGTLLYHRMDTAKAYYWLTTSVIHHASTLKDWGWIQQTYKRDNPSSIDELFSPFVEKNGNQMRILKSQWLKSFINIKAKMEEELMQCMELWGSKAHKEAVNSFLKKQGKK
ncbi:enoyl-CoA hydratase/carnithine racemase [Salirhabdus euzebyi]|uniref:Enoyl-CoA hydratase/carnithine racemase n=1 Tax=Salirhabdus euzebyi TaxID=394506 RepID=A0A841Q9G5_9BACI|nr:enoyl-CoA hydratase/isomerase family protein [Salirhabdus euzebyi]MBB6455015.1 enoyl-CoA hydratase/carnithine racemase [Salirhabdus euzebyi]